jgi:hypothetical protein
MHSAFGVCLYQRHVSVSMVDWARTILGEAVIPELVDEGIVMKESLEQLSTQMMTLQPPQACVTASATSSGEATHGSTETIGRPTPRYWQALGLLLILRDTLRLTVLTVPKMVGSTEEHVTGDGDQVILCLRVACIMKDIHKFFGLAVSPLPPKPEALARMGDIVGRKAPLLSKLQTSVGDLESNLTPALSTAIALTNAGTILPVSLSVIKHWQKLVAMASRRLIDETLAAASSILRVATQVGSGALPVWKSCITDQELQTENAFEVAAGKTHSVIEVHNGVHCLVTGLADVFEQLGVTPGPEKHSITSASIAIAKTYLADAKMCHIICKGVDILKSGTTLKSAAAAANWSSTHDRGSAPWIPQRFHAVIKELGGLVSSMKQGAASGCASGLDAQGKQKPPASAEQSAVAAPKKTVEIQGAASSPTNVGSEASIHALPGAVRRGLKRSRASEALA